MMGITIFARGTIDRLDDIPQLIEEVKGIAERRGWGYSVIDEDFAMEPALDLARPRLKGIVLSVDPKCEPLAILFDGNGSLTNLMQLLFKSSCTSDERYTACKTQYGAMESHVHIVELLDALKHKFITNLSVDDEGDYWESRDVGRLSNKRCILVHYLQHVEDAIAGMRLSKQDKVSAESVASQIEQILRESEENLILH